MSTYIHRMQITSGRTVVAGVIVALHVAFIAGLMAWKIAESTSENSATAIKLAWITQPKQPKPVPIVTKASDMPVKPVEEVTVPIPEPEVANLPAEPESSALAATVDDSAAQSVDTPLQFRAVRPADDYYPPQAIRMNQVGAAIIRTCVDASGHLTSKPQVVTSSSAPLLDTAAVTWASEALRFTPATRGGVPVASCKDFRVKFKLR
jgi:TonB family protein